MKKTGVFANKKEITLLKKMAKDAASVPAWGVTMNDFANNLDRGTVLWHKAQKKCHEFALKHGLPEIKGFYGLDSKGEFVEV